MKNRRKIGFIIILTIIILITPKIIKNFKSTMVSSKDEVHLIKEIETGYDEDIIYIKTKDGIIQYWDGILYAYDVMGAQTWNTHLGIINPIIKVKENSVYIVDNNTNQLVKIDEKGEVLYRYTFESPLNNFSIDDDGYIILQYPLENNMVKLKILNEEGRPYSEILLTEGDVMNTSISKEYDFVAVNTLITNNVLESRILTYDIKGQLIGSNQLDDQLVLEFGYDKKGNLITITEEEVFAIDKDNKILWKTPIDKIKKIKKLPHEYMVFYCQQQRKNPFVHAGGEEDLKIMKYDGKVIGKGRLDEEILGLDLDMERIVLHSNRSIYLLDRKGKLKKEHKYTSDIENVFVFPKGYLTVIYKGKISFYKIN